VYESIFVCMKTDFLSAYKQRDTRPRMQRCMAIKLDGLPCTRMGNGVVREECPHLRYCGTHWTAYNRHVAQQLDLHPNVNPHHQPGMCHSFTRTGWCGNPAAPGTITCQAELDRRRAEQEMAQRRIIAEGMVDVGFQEYIVRVPPPTWIEVVLDLFQNRPDLHDMIRYRIALRYFHARAMDHGIPRWQFEDYLRWVRGGRVGLEPVMMRDVVQPPPPPPRQGLAAIAHDRQNVHTRYVSEQTNRGLEKLLHKQATHPRTLNASSGWLIARWLTMSIDTWPTIVRVGDDMWRWYTTRTCRTPEDRLYKKALDGLYLIVRDTTDESVRRELYKRTWEECLESVGMCCDGHISRLCNVLVGFDDAFAPPVPFGEILQARMSMIAGLDVDTEEKVRQATAFFNEFAVPEVDRVAWLEAF
jgi:hypothetical protein